MRILILLILLILPYSANAGKNMWDGQVFIYDDRYSLKIFRETLVDIPDGTTVYGSSFYQEDKPNAHLFRPNMTGVTFYSCNLDNVFIPPGNHVIGGTNRLIKNQKDNEDWVLDNQLKPTEPVCKERLESEGKNTDPTQIPK